MTSYRLRSLYASKGTSNPGLLESNLYVNSRVQSPALMVDNPEQVAELVCALKAKRIEFAVFDVFNVLHSADETRQLVKELASQHAVVPVSPHISGILWLTIGSRPILWNVLIN